MNIARMWRGIAVFALLMVAFALVAPPEQATRQPERRSEKNIQKAYQAVTAVKNEPQPAQYYRPCRQHEENRSSDLCAQWKAADAAQSASDAAWGVGTAGAFLGFLTLIVAVKAALYARDAARHTETGAGEAKRSADAAEKAIGETTRIGEAQVRAYVSVIQRKAIWVAPRQFKFDLTVTNSGQSPAHRVHLTCQLMILDNSGFMWWERTIFKALDAIPSGVKIPLAAISIEIDENFAPLISPGNVLRLVARVDFIDVFKRPASDVFLFDWINPDMSNPTNFHPTLFGMERVWGPQQQ